MAKSSPLNLGKRERQIVEAVYRLGEASVAQVLAELPQPPSYSAVRALMMTLVTKKILSFRQDGKKYLYRATMPHKSAGRSALHNLLHTFFGGKTDVAVAALLDVSADTLTNKDFDNLRQLIEKARKENR